MVSAEEMGAYQTALSMALIAQPLATLRRELMIPFSDANGAESQRRTGLAFATFCSMVILAAAAGAWLYGGVRLATVLLSTAFILWSLALLYIENAYLIRRGGQARLATRNLVGGVLSALMQVLAAFLAPGAVTLAAALLIGRVVATTVTVMSLPPMPETSPSVERRPQRTVSAIASAMMASASSQAVVVGTFATFGAADAAQVGVAQRIASTPTSLIGQALTQIALSEAAPLIREGRSGLTKQLRAQTLKSAMLAFPVALMLAVGGSQFAGFVLGAGWEEAGDLTAIFAVPLSLTFVALPATTLLIPLGRERLLVVLQVVRLVAILASLSIASALTDEIVVTCAITAAAWSLAYVPLLTAAFTATAGHDRTARHPV
jgi:O-antigen/teichoic acid export membrane protein